MQTFMDTANKMAAASKEGAKQGAIASAAAVAREAVPTTFCALAALPRAASHLLTGVRNQIDPDSYNEQHNKLKNH